MGVVPPQPPHVYVTIHWSLVTNLCVTFCVNCTALYHFTTSVPKNMHKLVGYKRKKMLRDTLRLLGLFGRIPEGENLKLAFFFL